MKYPRQRDYRKDWHFGDEIWRVKFVRHIPHRKGRICFGMTDPETQTIVLRLGQKPAMLYETFWHEIFHIFEDVYGFKIPHRVIYNVERPIARFHIDNFF